jgi:hypothetical protein
MAYRPTPPAVAYHVPNQVKVISCHPTSCLFPFSFQTFFFFHLVLASQQDVASKSLSGLESLVDQIPNMADGEQNQQQQHQQQQQQQHPNGLHGQQPVAVSTSFGHYSTAPAQPSFSYPSTSFGHYAPHYTTPNGGSFPPNLYNPGTTSIHWTEKSLHYIKNLKFPLVFFGDY